MPKKKTNKRTRLTKFVCPNCGATKQLDGNKITRGHWCECNPNAPYKMVNEEISKLVSRHVNDAIWSMVKQQEHERVERLKIKAYIPK